MERNIDYFNFAIAYRLDRLSHSLNRNWFTQFMWWKRNEIILLRKLRTKVLHNIWDFRFVGYSGDFYPFYDKINFTKHDLRLLIKCLHDKVVWDTSLRCKYNLIYELLEMNLKMRLND